MGRRTNFTCYLPHCIQTLCSLTMHYQIPVCLLSITYMRLTTLKVCVFYILWTHNGFYKLTGMWNQTDKVLISGGRLLVRQRWGRLLVRQRFNTWGTPRAFKLTSWKSLHRYCISGKNEKLKNVMNLASWGKIFVNINFHIQLFLNWVCTDTKHTLIS